MKFLRPLLLCLCTLAAFSQQTPPTARSTTELQRRLEAFLRELYAWGPAFQIRVGEPSLSPVPGLLRVPVTVTYQGQTEQAALLVSQDGRYLIRGQLDDMLADPFQGNRSRLRLEADPATGPPHACVTVVEFSDYQCPHCRDAYAGLEKLRAQFPQVRFVFKDFPITQIHPWAMTAALAARCVYQQKPDAFAAFQKAVFESQDRVTADNAWDELSRLAAQMNLDVQTLHACMAAPTTQQLVNQDLEEGKSLSVTSTPTFFVNGRPLAGGDETLLAQYISYELGRCSGGSSPK